MKKLIKAILILLLFSGCAMWHALPANEPESKDRQEELKKKKEKRKKAAKRIERGV